MLARTRLDEILGELTGPAERSGPGRRWHCPAPDHDDHRASVTMHTDRYGHERWRCWSGDHRGDAIDLVMIRRGGSRLDAVDWLATRPDVPRPAAPTGPAKGAPHAGRHEHAPRRRTVRTDLRSSPVGTGRSQRADVAPSPGFDEATIRANRLGCDPGRTLLRRRRGLPYGKVPAATFPALSPTGQITFVQARYLDVNAAGRKYDNPAGALAPHPRIAFTVTATPARWPLLMVCEGMPDALTAAQAGYRAVALLGAHAPDESVAARVAGYAEAHHLDVVVMTDANEPGRAAGNRLSELLRAERIDPCIVEPPAGLTASDGSPVVDLNAWAQLDPQWSGDLNRALDVDAIDTAPGAGPLHQSPDLSIED